MKAFRSFLIATITTCCSITATKAQDVYINVPVNSIFDRTEYTSLPTTVMNTNRSNWDYNFWGFLPTDPTFTSTSGPNFTHNASTSTLPSSVLLWQLESMGGRLPATGLQGYLPDFQSFKTSPVLWFGPPISAYAGGFNPGNINFTFKVPGAQFSAYAVQAGNYTMNISQNYSFTPSAFKTILVIPASIRWVTSVLTKYIEISSLSDYRITGNKVLGNLGSLEVGHTTNFNLWAKAASSTIQFTSTKGVNSTRNISTIKLGSNSNVITPKNLSATYQNFSAAANPVVVGNRTSFIPELSLTAEDFKNLFFEAGTYTFELNLNARSVDNAINTIQNTSVQLKVLPKSEIIIPSSGQNVNFNFNTAAHYANGQTQTIPGQISLSNNENYELYVKSDENYFKKSGLQADINSNILQVGIDGGSVSAALSKTPQKILSNGTPVLDRSLNVKYTIPASGAQTLVGKENSTYSINVYYSFTAI